MSLWRLPLVLVLAAIPVSSAPALRKAPSPASPQWQRIAALEEANDLQSAIDLLKNDAAPEAQKHLKALKTLLLVRRAPEEYRLRFGKDLAGDLKKTTAELDQPADAVLRNLNYSEIVALETGARKAGDQRALQLLTEADQAVGKKDFERASSLYNLVAASSDDISPELRFKAQHGKIDMELRLAQEKRPSFFSEIFDGVRKTGSSLILWTVYLCAVLGVIALARKLKQRFHPKPGIRISFHDLSSAAAEKAIANSVLNLEIQRLLSPVDAYDNDEPIQVETNDDVDGAFIGSIRPLEQPPLVDEIIRDDEAMKIGPISFNVRQLLRFISSLFERHYDKNFQGTLVTKDEKTTVSARLSNSQQKQALAWTITCAGVDHRHHAVRELAARFAINRSRNLSTENWRSYDQYRDGLEALTGPVPDPQKACESFQKAVHYDPQNWLARFHLANTLRRCGRNEAAVQNFSYLESALQIEPGSRPQSLAKYVDIRPEFLQIVQYCNAVALCKLATWDSINNAMDVFRFITSLTDPMRPVSEKAKPDSLQSLHPLAVGGVIVCLGFQTEELFRRKAGFDREGKHEAAKRTSERIKASREEIIMLVRALESLTVAGNSNNAVYLNSALATALNSYARVVEAYGDSKQALEKYERVITLLPDFVDAYINMASLYINSRQSRLDWVERATAKLEKALQLNPANYKAHLLMGRLLADRGVQRFKEAIAELQKAGSTAKACLYLARIYNDPNFPERNPEESIRLLRKSIALDRRCDYRYLELIDLLMAQASKTPDLLSEARSLADKLEKKGETQNYKRQGKLRLANIDKILKANQQGQAVNSAQMANAAAAAAAPAVAATTPPEVAKEGNPDGKG